MRPPSICETLQVGVESAPRGLLTCRAFLSREPFARASKSCHMTLPPLCNPSTCTTASSRPVPACASPSPQKGFVVQQQTQTVMPLGLRRTLSWVGGFRVDRLRVNHGFSHATSKDSKA